MTVLRDHFVKITLRLFSCLNNNAEPTEDILSDEITELSINKQFEN